MYRVLLVEDEILERENMRESWIWKDNDFILQADAGNGEEAWEILKREKIDIVVTDIKMPFRDGLDLSRQIQEEMPRIKIIIMSGFSDFQFARRALSIGVSEYIVKPIRSSDLLDALKKVAAKLKEEDLVYEEVSLYREQLQTNRQKQRQQLLEDLTLGIAPIDKLKKQAGLQDLNLAFDNVCCAIIAYLDDKILIDENEHLQALECQQVVEDFIKSQDVLSFNRNLRESVLIYRDPYLPAVKKMLAAIYDTIAAECCLSTHICQPTIALGSVKKGITGIAESFADARFLINFQHLVGHDKLLFMDDALPALQNSYGSELILANDKESIVNILNMGNKSDVPAIVDRLVQRLQSINLSMLLFQYACVEIANILVQFLVEIDEDPNETLIDKSGTKNALLSGNWLIWSNDIPAFRDYLTKTLMTVMDIRDKKKKYKYNNVILKAKKYIDQHFADPDICLTQIAASVNVNPSYFSSLFTQEIGESFIEYLTRMRIDKAKTLMMTTSMRTVDIAFAVGYTDSNYFSKIFRKMTNESPRDYKNKS